MSCQHFAEIADVTPSAAGCEDCLRTGGQWVHLRMCRACGHVGCCDSSPNRHATKHYVGQRHPVVQSVEPGESWLWCYVDEEVQEPA
ncbi:UBP-type zinc finger domain-containing protein [Myceligenerans halotolerans]